MVLKLGHFVSYIQKYLGSFEMRCWGWMKISWTNRVKHEVLHRIGEEKNILRTVKRRKANWIGHVLFMNCFLKYNVEGKIK